MSKRLPDEYFRQTSTESSDIRSDRLEPTRPRKRSSMRRQGRVPVRIVLASCAAALLLGFAGTKVATELTLSDEAPSPTPVVTTRLDLAPYSGRTTPVSVINARGNCARGGPDLAATLIDSSPETVWRCSGSGVGEAVTFEFIPGTKLVGLRLVNGNLVNDAYRKERRILSVRWTFSDGTWVVQPLSANQTGEQEVRFPPIATDQAVMSILTTTEPGIDDGDHDAVAVSRVTFLTQA